MIESYLDKDEKYTFIDDNQNYIITSKGKLFEVENNNFHRIDTFIFQNTYEYAVIYDYEKNPYKFYIHDLVFTCFKSSFDSRFFNVVHKNGNTLDNRIENLRVEFIRKDKSFIEKYEDAINIFLEEDTGLL